MRKLSITRFKNVIDIQDSLTYKQFFAYNKISPNKSRYEYDDSFFLHFENSIDSLFINKLSCYPLNDIDKFKKKLLKINTNVVKSKNKTSYFVNGKYGDNIIISLSIVFSRHKMIKDEYQYDDYNEHDVEGKQFTYNKRTMNITVIIDNDVNVYNVPVDNNFNMLFELLKVLIHNEVKFKSISDAVDVFRFDGVKTIKNIKFVDRITNFKTEELINTNGIIGYRSPYYDYYYDDFHDDNNFIFIKADKKITVDGYIESEYYRQLCRNEFYCNHIEKFGWVLKSESKVADFQELLYSDCKHAIVGVGNINEDDKDKYNSGEYYLLYKDVSIILNDDFKECKQIINKINLLYEFTQGSN